MAQEHSQGAQQDGEPAEARGEQYEQERRQFFTSPIQTLTPQAGVSGRDFFAAMARSGGPMRNLAGVYVGWEEMLRASHQSVWLTIAGAYVPFGLGTTVKMLLDRRFVDVLVTTPAQLTHDLTAIRGRSFYHGSEEVDDDLLQRLDVNRYWNTFGDELELNSNREPIWEFAETLSDRRGYTPSELFYRLGLWLERSPHKKVDGILTAAARAGIPIFCPSPADADIAGDISHYRKRTGRRLVVDPLKETLDMVAYNAAVEDAGGRCGMITLGGGAPRNYGQQAMACSYMIDRPDLKKYNYGLRISLDPVQTGGLSGSTISEGKTWKKYAPDVHVAEYFGDFMVPLAQMTQALLDAFPAPRTPPTTIRYEDDGRLIVTVEGKEVDLQATYGYA